IEEWRSAGYSMDASESQNEELKALYESVPEALRLQFERQGNYGIPYNIEGYGLIANKQLLQEILDLDSIEGFKSDYKAATYEEFQGMLEALDAYIKSGSGSTFLLNDNTYTVRDGKTSLTEELTGVLAIAGAEKWTYGNHYGNYPVSAVYETIYDVREAEPSFADHLKSPIVKSLQELDYLTRFAAGAEGPVERGPQFINSTVTGYDQAIQMIAERKAIFIKNGNWIYPNVAKISEETAENLIMLPLKVNFSDEDIQVQGLTVEQMNCSIPEFVSQYYVINAKATEEERREAEDFLLWLNTSEAGQNFIINDFAFVPFNADENIVLDNPLSNDLIRYKEEEHLLANPFDAPPASWGLESYGKYIMEELFTNPEDWTEEQLEEIADKCVADWKSGMEEW
ncbi:MAG: extracellular solute-binding protein, partial [Acetatifactor sp.]|nr:extracellular solute-binding protein [Acetatifactor sp.]